ncbi:hypothetical protein [Leptolyngbya iicbica]|uniref:Uncharacterized protein n=1 Tax=Lyngbya confervoides BDU141951 TaxID=1574623 RepID=A0A8T6QPL6_9CYAN
MNMLGIALILNRLTAWQRHWQTRWGRSRPFQRWRLWGVLILGLALGPSLTSCREDAIAAPRSVAIDQTWELTLGNVVEGFRVVAGLGDVTMQLRGARVRAPFDGEVQPSADGPDCIFFASPEVPAYLFRFCGLMNPRVGEVEAGDSLGRSQYLHFTTMRRQPDGTWAIVEPSTGVLERSLQRF